MVGEKHGSNKGFFFSWRNSQTIESRLKTDLKVLQSCQSPSSESLLCTAIIFTHNNNREHPSSV